ncbi:MAG: tRNA (adenosine(37)-N6)-dimethylallyltransferase MiaA [Candidatus Nanopelagicaceae bacterium]|nr:tRNA (adenosine(37)-N6)-dimethylallyltransferase MiaA [Candidatus Nanopelagicaceae bacterium]
MTLIFIVGATATGKSELSLQLAEQLSGEIVNADSMQLYRGMDIGTAKLSPQQRRGIPHHLIDVLDVTQDASVAEYQLWARSKIDELLGLGKAVIVVGGTGLYVKAILDELNFPDTDPEVRARLSEEAERIGGEAMHERLGKLDPAAAAAIPKENVRRVVRALEVIEITGKPFTAHLPRAGATYYPDAKQFGLVMDRDDLKERIDKRVDLMWSEGFVGEVRELIEKGITSGKTAKAALGYNQIISFLEGRISEAEAKEETKRATRAYARRQETWFSRDARIKWLKGGTKERLDSILSSTISR